MIRLKERFLGSYPSSARNLIKIAKRSDPKMKRIYDFSRKPAKRNYTISDLQDLKVTGQKLSMANPLNADEIRACRDAGIDLFVCGIDQLDDVR